MLRCPRCGSPPDHPSGRLLALSRLDNKSHLCEACGADEALLGSGFYREPHQTLTFDWKKKMSTSSKDSH